MTAMPKTDLSELQGAVHREKHLKLRVWRQRDGKSDGKFVDYEPKGLTDDMSFLEMLDILNEELMGRGEDPVSFDHDCREGICGSCALMINGEAHGPVEGATACQVHLRTFQDGQTIVVEPWRARPFPVIKDLVVNRKAFDRIVQAGGFISVNTGGAPDANLIPVPKTIADTAMDAAECIACGACVAACKNASAMLFVSAKISHLNLLPQGKQEKDERVLNMIQAHDEEGFGACSNTNSCEAVCPKQISVNFIAKANRDYAWALLRGKRPTLGMKSAEPAA
jgi:succinate dehydrogenase / fumarate reductase iron-sulfur subunit